MTVGEMEAFSVILIWHVTRRVYLFTIERWDSLTDGGRTMVLRCTDHWRLRWRRMYLKRDSYTVASYSPSPSSSSYLASKGNRWVPMLSRYISHCIN